MFRSRWSFLIFFVLPIGAIAQQAPVFDPLNPPDSAVEEKPRTGQSAKKPAAPIETMVVTPTPESPARAPVAGQPAPAAAQSVAAPTVPRVVAYDELEAQVGKQIRVKTNLRTQRTGMLKRFNRAVLIIEDRSRGFAMDVEIPRPTVVEVTLID